MWVDGTKIIDVCQTNVGVTPSGGGKPWCTQDTVDQIPVNDGFAGQYGLIFGETLTASPCAVTLDYDIDTFSLSRDA